MDLKFLKCPTLAVYNNLYKNHLHIMDITWDLNKGLINLYLIKNKNQWAKWKVHVMKVVDLVTRNTDQLSLNFSDFSTNLYRFYKFAVFENKKKRKWDLASRPLERFGRLQIGPWPDLEQGRRRGAGFRRGNSPAAWNSKIPFDVIGTYENYELIRLIRFVSRISTQLSKNIYKQILFNTIK